MTIRRFDNIEISVPPQTPCVLTITCREKHDRPATLPDLAIDPENIGVSGIWTSVTVHNIGNADADDFTVSLYMGGEIIDTRRIDRLSAPCELLPNTYTVYFVCRATGEPIEAAVDEEDNVMEILERNNNAVASDYRGSDYFECSDIPYVP